MKKKLAALAAAGIIALLPLFGALGFANTADDKRAELNDVKQQMADMQARKEEARRKAESANAQLAEIMDNLGDRKSVV